MAQHSLVENVPTDVMTIDQKDSDGYFMPLPTHHMSIIFFPPEFII